MVSKSNSLPCTQSSVLPCTQIFCLNFSVTTGRILFKFGTDVPQGLVVVPLMLASPGLYAYQGYN